MHHDVATTVLRSDDFRRLWAENEVRNHGVGRKRLHHRIAGPLTLEYSAFNVDGADGLSALAGELGAHAVGLRLTADSYQAVDAARSVTGRVTNSGIG